MRTLSFPGLGLSFDLDPIAFSLFGWPIHWYGVIIACGFVLAVLVCDRLRGRVGLREDDIMDFILFGAPIGIIGARLYYVIFYLDRFRLEDDSLDFPAMVRIWDGGLAIYGGVIAGALTLLVFCKVRKISFLAFADLGVCGLMIGQSIGRWGNFVNIEAYGSVTDLPWRMCSESIANTLLNKGLVDAASYQAILDGTLGVHPTFFYESMWNLLGLILVIALIRRGRRFDGETFFFYLAWYGLGRCVIEGLRTDSLYFFSTGLRVSQVVGLVSGLVGVALLVWNLKFRPHRPEDLFANRVKAEQDKSADA